MNTEQTRKNIFTICKLCVIGIIFALRASSITHFNINVMAKAKSCLDFGWIYCRNREVEIWRRALSIFVKFYSPLETSGFFHNIWMAKRLRVPGKDFIVRILLKKGKYSRKWYLSQHEIYKTL